MAAVDYFLKIDGIEGEAKDKTLSSVFLFQAEDGIRDALVTGVQKCALPIWIWLADANWMTAPCSVSEAPAVVSTTCRSEEHTSELQSLRHLVCRLLLEKKT